MKSNKIDTFSKYSDGDLKNIYENIFKELNSRNINVNNLQNKYYQHRCFCLLGISHKIIKLKIFEEYDIHYISEKDFKENYTNLQLFFESYDDGSGEISFDIYTKKEKLTKKEKASLKEKMYEKIMAQKFEEKIEEKKVELINKIEKIKINNKEKISTFFKDIIRKEKIKKLKNKLC